jgi:hypothetical protein
MAPWLEDRVIDAVQKDAAGRSARRFDGRDPRLVIAAFAAVLIAVLAVAVLVGTRFAVHPTTAPASKPSPSQDAAVLRYQARINGDMRPIYGNFGLICISRQQCIAAATQIRAATEVLLQEVESTPAPAPLVPAAAQLKTAAQQYIATLDAYIAAEQDPNTNYLSPADPSSNNVDLAAATVGCWPGAPDVARGDQYNGYSCAIQPPAH